MKTAVVLLVIVLTATVAAAPSNMKTRQKSRKLGDLAKTGPQRIEEVRNKKPELQRRDSLTVDLGKVEYENEAVGVWMDTADLESSVKAYSQMSFNYDDDKKDKRKKRATSGQLYKRFVKRS